MPDSLARARLARAAAALANAARSPLPALVLVTDDERLPDPCPAIEALPRGSLVVLRTRDSKRRTMLANLLVRLSRHGNLKWIVADDPSLAAKLGADGAHFPEREISQAARWRVRRPDWFLTCAAHSLRACLQAKRAGVNAVLLSPVFPTGSHPGRADFGCSRARLISQAAPLRTYALGGVDVSTAGRLAGSTFVGLAAVGGLAVR